MFIERIHFYLLSLAIRGTGVYFLIDAAITFQRTVSFLIYPNPANQENAGRFALIWLSYFIIKFLLALYFLRGAPPALKWIQFPKPDRDDQAPSPKA